MIDFSTLNESQRIAVNWEKGPLLVLAGPGSGKTRTLTLRIARLIQESPNKYFKVLGLTFTNKAAAEMRNRIAELVPNSLERPHLTTFHSFAADILRQHGHYIGLKPDFTILSQEADRYALLDEVINDSKIGHVRQYSEKLLPIISRLTENDISPDKVHTELKKFRLSSPVPLAEIYKRYRSLMIEKNSLDFTGLIAEALGLLQNRSSLRKQVQRVYPFICIDEFQDTNLAQYKFLRHLVNSETKNLFVVADDDKIIYQWNGASPERLNKLQNELEMKQLQLPENYRCPTKVVALANKLIEHNPCRLKQKDDLDPLQCMSGDNVVIVKGFQDFTEEAAWVAKTIASHSLEYRAKCVVLSRTKKLLDPIVNAFNDIGVASYVATRKNEFECPPLIWLHSILRLANSRNNREYLRRTCKSFHSLEGISLNTKNIISHASATDGDFLRSWAEAALGNVELSKGAYKLIKFSLVPTLLERLDYWKFQKEAFTWLDSLIQTAPGSDPILDEYAGEKHAWDQLVTEVCAQFGKSEVTLFQLLQELDLRSKASDPPKNAVPCFTIHASKGMEFGNVYLVGLVEDQFPSWAARRKGDNSPEMQEERRNCFVAITRVQETLTLTYSGRIEGWIKKPSRFLSEMGFE